MPHDLSTLRVLELGGGISAATAGKLLADLGARVVKLEPPEGDALRRAVPLSAERGGERISGSFVFLNTNKRSLVLDPEEQGTAAEVQRMAAHVDLILHDLPPARMAAWGLDFETLSGINPALVLCSITPFGLSGPHSDYAANDLTLVHAGGWGWLCPGKDTPIEHPPIKPFGQHALTQAGLHAAAIALGSVIGARRQGHGDHIDISVQEAIAFMLGRHFAVVSYAEKVDSRTSPAAYEPMSFYPCKDGYVFLICPEQNQFDRLVELMGNPDWAQDERFGNRHGREVHARELKARLSEWTVTKNMEELYHACQKMRVGAAPVFDYPALEAQEHLHERGFFVEQDHPVAGRVRLPGAPFKMREPMWRLERPAPALGEAEAERATLFPPRVAAPAHGSASQPGNGRKALPLSGLRVLDLSWVWAGPHCTQLLALLGAEVIKVETSDRPDLTRRSHLFASGMEPGLNRCGYFNQINQGKLGIGVNLASEEGKGLVKRLAETSDLMISNFGTGVLERLGLGPDVMQAINPRMVVAMISAFGQTGSCRHYMGYGPLISPLAGLSAQTGYEDGVPQDVGLAYGDPNGGIYTTVAVLASWLADPRIAGNGDPDGSPERPGQVIDLSMWEAMLCTAFEGWMNHALGNPPFHPMANRSPQHAPHNLYPCRGDDVWLAVAVQEEAQWRALCRVLGRPDLAEDSRFGSPASRKEHEAVLDAVLEEWCEDRDAWEATRLLQAEGVPAFPSMSTRDLLDDPHMLARSAFTHWPHKEAGARALMGPYWRMHLRPNGLGKAAPCLGEDTDEVLERLLGLDAGTRADLRARGIVE